jgi:hypothetical protein
MKRDRFPFILAGGIFKVVPWLVAELTKRLRDIAPESTIDMLTAEPAQGAVWLALAEARGGATVPAYA